MKLSGQRPARHPIAFRACAALAAGAMALVACGGDDGPVVLEQPDTVSDGSSDAPVATVQETGDVTVEGDPLAPYDSSIEDLAVGTAAPVVSGETFDGTPVTIGGPTANPTMVVFLAHWCPHCNEEIPELVSLTMTKELPEGLDVIGVSTSVDEGAENYPPSEWIVEKGWPYPTMADDDDLTAIGSFGGTSFPFTVVLDSDGTVLARRAGKASGDETLAFLDAALGA